MKIRPPWVSSARWCDLRNGRRLLSTANVHERVSAFLTSENQLKLEKGHREVKSGDLCSFVRVLGTLGQWATEGRIEVGFLRN